MHLHRPEGAGGTKGCGFGMDAMGTANHHRGAMGFSHTNQNLQKFGTSLVKQTCRLVHERAPRRVNDVGRGEPVVNPGGLGATDGILHHVHKCCDVVIGDEFAFGDRGHERVVNFGGARPTGRGGTGGGHAQLFPRLNDEQFDLEVSGEPGPIGENLRHLGPCVAFNHGKVTICSRPGPTPTKRIFTPTERSSAER